jgi:hypothetical protein
MWTRTFNQDALENLKLPMQITLFMLPLEYRPIEVVIVGQIGPMFDFDNINKTI